MIEALTKTGGLMQLQYTTGEAQNMGENSRNKNTAPPIHQYRWYFNKNILYWTSHSPVRSKTERVPEVATHDGEKVVQVLETAVCSPPQQVGVTSRKSKHAQLGH